jgi:hypothetical protein
MNKLEEQSADAQQGCSVTTGGGFSLRYTHPLYQTYAVKRFFDQADTAASESYFSKAGRGYPDLALASTNFLAFEEPLGLQSYGSTGASASAMTAIVALLNQNQLGQEKPQLGFLNPMLYSIHEFEPGAFIDVVHGNNRCSRTPKKCCHIGFDAAKGWDPVSGLGTPHVGTLLRSIANWNASDCILGNSSMLDGCGKYATQASRSQFATSAVLVIAMGAMIIGLVAAFLNATRTNNRRDGYHEVRD